MYFLNFVLWHGRCLIDLSGSLRMAKSARTKFFDVDPNQRSRLPFQFLPDQRDERRQRFAFEHNHG
jgi:hypothetical protein